MPLEALNAILARNRNLRNTATPYERRPRDAEKDGVEGVIRLMPALKGHDCASCGNKGYAAASKDGRWLAKACACLAIRESMHRIEKSGLGAMLKECTFDTFLASENWQHEAKSAVMRYAETQPQERASWLFVGGQPGSGKTHLCTAAIGRFLDRGKSARYMLWRDASVQLKAIVNMHEEYAKEITPLKTVDVLYIDDFFKTERGKAPTTADINLAFEILNYRYNRQELLTVISTERLLFELLDFDEAVGSRIYHRTAGYRIEIQPSAERNYRLREAGCTDASKRI